MKIFCKDKFLAETKRFEVYHQNGASWPNRCHGRAVEERTVRVVDKFGLAIPYGVVDEWCIDSKPLVEYFKKEDVSIHVGNGWEFDTFMKMCSESGIRWRSGELCGGTYKPHLTKRPNDERCIVFNYDEKCITQCDILYFQREGIKIIEYSDLVSLGYKLEKLENEITIPDNITYHVGARGCGKTAVMTFVDEFEKKTEPISLKSDDPFVVSMSITDDVFEKIRKSIDQNIIDSVMRDPYDIHISSNGYGTTARFYRNGKLIKETKAELHPDDKFNFHIGAELAFDRLFEKKPKEKKIEEEMPKADLNNLKPGDKVRVRKDLEAGRAYGDVYVNGRMQSLAGKVVTISDAAGIHIFEDAESWYWSREMFELI